MKPQHLIFTFSLILCQIFLPTSATIEACTSDLDCPQRMSCNLRWKTCFCSDAFYPNLETQNSTRCFTRTFIEPNSTVKCQTSPLISEPRCIHFATCIEEKCECKDGGYINSQGRWVCLQKCNSDADCLAYDFTVCKLTEDSIGENKNKKFCSCSANSQALSGLGNSCLRIRASLGERCNTDDDSKRLLGLFVNIFVKVKSLFTFYLNFRLRFFCRVH